MQITRQAILDYLRVHREATVRDLSRVLSLTTTGVRQHMAVLEGDGLVTFRDLKGRVGRPAQVYRLTEDGEARYPKSYDRLALAILDAAREVCDVDLYPRLVGATATHLATPVQGASSGSVAERAAVVTEHLRAEGSVAEVVSDPDGSASGTDEATIVQHTCPYLNAAILAPMVCAIDVASIEQATDCRVALLESRIEGSERCVFHLSLTEAS